MGFECFGEFHWELLEFNWKLKVPVQTGTEPGRQVAKADSNPAQTGKVTRFLSKSFKRSRMQNALVEDHQAHP